MKLVGELNCSVSTPGHMENLTNSYVGIPKNYFCFYLVLRFEEIIHQQTAPIINSHPRRGID